MPTDRQRFSDYASTLIDAAFGVSAPTTLPTPDSIALGWRGWLPLMGPETFTKPFGDMHIEYWDGVWSIMVKRMQGIPLNDDEHVFLAVIFRGGGKSSMVEWTAIMEGALLGTGYTLYVSGTQDLAQGHLEAIRDRLERSQVAKYYPGLANPKVGKFGQRFGWRQDALVTQSGWGIAAFGLDTGIRGGKLVDQRPSLIIMDDIDSLEDTPVTVNKKIATLSRSIFPSGTSDTVILGAQNLIHTNSVMNKIVTRSVGLLANRKETKIWPAVYGLATERRGDRDIIVQGEPVWEGFDLFAAQKEIDRDGLEAFLAEHQHDFEASLEGLIVPEYNESVHIISWSQFASVYGVRSIPGHWQKEVSLDWGSSGLHAHPTAVSFIATASEDSDFPGLHFLYHGMTFGEGVMVQDVGDRILAITGEIDDPYSTDERRRSANLDGYHRWVASHEAKSERDTFRRLYGLPFQASKSSATSGIAQWRQFMRVDYQMQHLFRPENNGFALFYWVVEDDQLQQAKDDKGLKRWREEVISWRWRPQDVGQAGLVREVPVKFFDDCSDTIRYLTAHWLPPKTPLSTTQVHERRLPAALQRDNMPTAPEDVERWAFARWLQEGRLQKREAMLAETRDRDSH